MYVLPVPLNNLQKILTTYITDRKPIVQLHKFLVKSL
jgi:hypothetical protein